MTALAARHEGQAAVIAADVAVHINTRIPDGIHVKVSYESLRTWYGQPEQVAP